MSNKSTGTKFEKDFAQILAENGFWAHCLKDNENGQPFDVIAARNGIAYAFDCKDCREDSFRLKRIEENQNNAMGLWTATGNGQGLFVIRFGSYIYLLPHKLLEVFQENGKTSITEAEALKYGKTLYSWLAFRNNMDRRAK